LLLIGKKIELTATGIRRSSEGITDQEGLSPARDGFRETD